jgi:CubicO group peptidase (beta-lactamase class C family)
VALAREQQGKSGLVVAKVDGSATIGSLQPEWKLRNPEAAKITLDALATHSSGLSRPPANLAPADP